MIKIGVCSFIFSRFDTKRLNRGIKYSWKKRNLYLANSFCLLEMVLCNRIHVQYLQVMGPDSLQFIRKLIDKLQLQQINILRFIACTEIFIMPAIIFMMFAWVYMSLSDLTKSSFPCINVFHVVQPMLFISEESVAFFYPLYTTNFYPWDTPPEEIHTAG